MFSPQPQKQDGSQILTAVSTNDLSYKFQDEKGTLRMGFILDVFLYENGKIEINLENKCLQ